MHIYLYYASTENTNCDKEQYHCYTDKFAIKYLETTTGVQKNKPLIYVIIRTMGINYKSVSRHVERKCA